MHMKQLHNGLLISLEGIDGSGKSTLAKNLATKLRQDNLPIILTKEPGSTALGATLRTLVQEKKVPINGQAEFLLFAADRAQHFSELVLPALEKGKIVISDRMADSSLAYQGYGRGLSIDLITTINSWVMHNRQPNIIFYLNVSIECAQQRITARNAALTSFEQEKKEFMERVAHGFDTIFKNKKNGVILDGTQSMDQLTLQAYNHVISWIKAAPLTS